MIQFDPSLIPLTPKVSSIGPSLSMRGIRTNNTLANTRGDIDALRAVSNREY